MVVKAFGGIGKSAWVIMVLTMLAQPAQANPCIVDQFEGAEYLICSIEPEDSNLLLFWRSSDGTPYRFFSSVAEAVREQGQELIFAINAGMYQRDFSPLGLHVENGEQLRPANTVVIDGPPRQIPNFYKMPNGIFFIHDEGADILPTDAFLDIQPDARFATQSGPLLVIDGQLHPALVPGSSDRTRRSGVGVCREGRIQFAISEGNVNFHDFARLFRDGLGCPNALFLDGGRGAGVYIPELGRNDFSWHGGYGPIFGLVE